MLSSSRLKGDDKERYAELAKKLKEFANLHPGELPVGSGMRDCRRSGPADLCACGGTYLGRQEAVQPAFLSVLSSKAPEIDRLRTRVRPAGEPRWPTGLQVRTIRLRRESWRTASGITTSGRAWLLLRAISAAWVGDPATPNCSDWLRREFVEKRLEHQEAAQADRDVEHVPAGFGHREDAAKIDARNRLLWRFPRNRLEGEVIRDSAIYVAGALNAKVGGPSVFPVLPENMPTPRGGWAKKPTADDNYRRSVYIFVRRNTPYPILKALDFPDTDDELRPARQDHYRSAGVCRC